MPDPQSPDAPISDEERKQFYTYYIGPEEDPCPGCGALWVMHTTPYRHGTRDHKPDCRYERWIHESETQRGGRP